MTVQLLFFVAAAAAVLCVKTITVINRATRDTSLAIILAWVALGGPSAWVLASVLLAHAIPDLAAALLIVGAAMVITLDRRRP